MIFKAAMESDIRALFFINDEVTDYVDLMVDGSWCFTNSDNVKLNKRSFSCVGLAFKAFLRSSAIKLKSVVQRATLFIPLFNHFTFFIQ